MQYHGHYTTRKKNIDPKPTIVDLRQSLTHDSFTESRLTHTYMHPPLFGLPKSISRIFIGDPIAQGYACLIKSYSRMPNYMQDYNSIRKTNVHMIILPLPFLGLLPFSITYLVCCYNTMLFSPCHGIDWLSPLCANDQPWPRTPFGASILNLTLWHLRLK